MVLAGSEQSSSAPAEFLFPKLNDGGSFCNPTARAFIWFAMRQPR